MFISTSSEEDASNLAELICFSNEVTSSKPARASRWQRVNQINQEADTTIGTESFAILDGYASPFTPLRERDIKALTELFDREDSDEIETNIISYLLLLWPDTGWENDIFDFLGEYL